jgi:hypothetical protein
VNHRVATVRLRDAGWRNRRDLIFGYSVVESHVVPVRIGGRVAKVLPYRLAEECKLKSVRQWFVLA